MCIWYRIHIAWCMPYESFDLNKNWQWYYCTIASCHHRWFLVAFRATHNFRMSKIRAMMKYLLSVRRILDGIGGEVRDFTAPLGEWICAVNFCCPTSESKLNTDISNKKSTLNPEIIMVDQHASKYINTKTSEEGGIKRITSHTILTNVNLPSLSKIESLDRRPCSQKFSGTT